MRLFVIALIFVLGAVPLSAQQLYTVGQDVEVYDPIEKNWFPSTVQKVDNQKYFIHYKNYDPKWDVWVDDTRIRKPGEKKDSPVFYLIGSTERLYTYYVGETVNMLYLNPDSVGFRSMSGQKGDLYTFKKLPGNDFLTGKQKIYESNLYVEWIDNNSFMLSRSHDNLSYYHRNKDAGGKLMNSGELSKHVDGPLEHIRQMETTARDAGEKSAKDAQFNTISNFVKDFKSKKGDAVLTGDITKWWNGDGKVVNPLLKVYIANSDYTVDRNEFGVILNKHVTALLVYKWAADGLCYVKWLHFGYENIGGSSYSTALKSWAPTDLAFSMGDQKLNANTPYVLDCKSVQ